MPTGLGRIVRDLATLLCRSPHFRVGHLGRGLTGARRLPFAQYAIHPATGQWGEGDLQRVWDDFAGPDEGVIFTIWDATRLLWFAQPSYLTQVNADLHAFLTSGRFERWGYFPIDSTGPNRRLTSYAHEVLLGYDRLLAYTKWGEGVMRQTLGEDTASQRHIDWLPHGLNLTTFKPCDRLTARQYFRWRQKDVGVGVVATNQTRKDWGLIFAAVAGLRQRVKHLKLWCHVDVAERHWSLPALTADFGLGDITTVTHSMTDTEMSVAYSACDVTLHPGGEGFGYPIFESLACNVPVVHGDYAGGADVLRQCGLHDMLVEPVTYRLDTIHNCLRAVYEPADWVDAIERVLALPPQEWRDTISYLGWQNLWPLWKRWFETGLRVELPPEEEL